MPGPDHPSARHRIVPRWGPWRLLAVALSLTLIAGAAVVGWLSARDDASVATADVAQVQATEDAASGSPTGSPSASPSSSSRGDDTSRQQQGRAADIRPARLVMEVVSGEQVARYSEEEWEAVLARRAAAKAAAAAEAGDAGSEAPEAEATGDAAPLSPGGRVTIRVASFNVLGSNHTCRGCPRNPPYPTAAVRTPRAAAKFGEHGVHVVGLQELKHDQLAGLRSRTGFAAYPASGDTDNAIMWNPGVFEFVSGSAFHTRFMSRMRPQTVLRLRHRSTGREMYFVNMHASAGGGKYAGIRKNNHHALANKVNQLKSAGVPIFVTGDMNDREAFFCRVAPPTGMVAAVGGNTNGGCHPPGRMPVDWVLGWGGVSWSGFRNDMSTLRRISDHHFVSATATIAPR